MKVTITSKSEVPVYSVQRGVLFVLASLTAVGIMRGDAAITPKLQVLE